MSQHVIRLVEIRAWIIDARTRSCWRARALLSAAALCGGVSARSCLTAAGGLLVTSSSSLLESACVGLMHHASTHSVGSSLWLLACIWRNQISSSRGKESLQRCQQQACTNRSLKVLACRWVLRAYVLYVDSVLTRVSTGGHEGVSGTPIVAVV